MCHLRCLLLILAALVACVHSHTLVKRMINGKPVRIADYPYQVCLRTRRAPCRSCAPSRCGGTILSRYYVLTAAHCINEPKDKYYIRAGSPYHHKGGSRHDLDIVTFHPKFGADAGEFRSMFDIAVIKVVEPFVYKRTIQPIAPARLELYQHYPVNTPARSAGWGKVDPSLRKVLNDWSEDNYPLRLHKLDFHIVDRKACNDSFAIWGGLFEGQFCAATDDPMQMSIWNGDSGSPLVIGREVVGITIWMGGMDIQGAPGVYTDVGYMRDWIDENVVYDDEEGVTTVQPVVVSL